MSKLMFAALIVAAAAAQTPTTPPAPAPPSPPACLSGPVTQGTVTLSCSAIDGAGLAPSDSLTLTGNSYIFQVRIASTDPTVVAIAAQLTIGQGASAQQRSVSIAPTGNSFIYTFVLPAVVGSNAAGATVISAPLVTAIQIQELKPSSTQTF